MMRSIVSRMVVSFCIAGAPLIGVACSTGSSGPAEEAEGTGTFTMPLIVTVGANTYRLNAGLDVYGPIYTFLYTSDDPAETQLTASLPAGSYFAYLTSWTLEKLDSSGNFVPVSATLVSPYYANFTIYNQSTSTISFQFETDGVVVTVGTGQLVVDFGVTERPAVCAILGDDCGAGSWCAPPELTGTGLACVPEGTTPLGEACGSPSECVRNASCIDFGGGPVCAGLCAPADFGAACASGGSCVAAGSNYGVCVPEGGTLPDYGGGGGSAGEGGVAGKGGFAGKGGVAGGRPIPMEGGASAGGSGGGF